MNKKFTLLSLLALGVTTANAQNLTSLTGDYSTKAYTITPDETSRGRWTFKPETGELDSVYTSKPVSINDCFTFVNLNGKYYLYSLGAKKFVTSVNAKGTEGHTTLTDFPVNYVQLDTNGSFAIVNLCVDASNRYTFGISPQQKFHIFNWGKNGNQNDDRGNKSTIAEQSISFDLGKCLATNVRNVIGTVNTDVLNETVRQDAATDQTLETVTTERFNTIWTTAKNNVTTAQLKDGYYEVVNFCANSRRSLAIVDINGQARVDTINAERQGTPKYYIYVKKNGDTGYTMRIGEKYLDPTAEGSNNPALSTTPVNVDITASADYLGWCLIKHSEKNGIKDYLNCNDDQLNINSLMHWTKDAQGSLWRFIPVKKYAQPIVLQINDGSGACYATAHMPFAYSLPENVDAYTVKVNENNASVTCTKVADRKVPANSSVILRATEIAQNDDWAHTLTLCPELGLKDSLANNDLYGTDVAIANWGTTHSNDLIFSADEGQSAVGFYKWNNTKNSPFPAYKCYLPGSKIAAAASKGLSVVWDEGETTSIETLKPVTTTQHNVYFDLQGRRVANPTKGVFIVNGKKVVIK